MGDLGVTEILIVLVVVVLLFGAKRLPDLARSSGRSLRIFKSEIKGLTDDDDKAVIEAPQTDEQRIQAAAEAAAKAEAARIEAEKHPQS